MVHATFRSINFLSSVGIAFAELPSTVVCTVSSATSLLAAVSERVYSGTKKVDWIEKFNAQLNGLTGTIASAVKKAAEESETAASTAAGVAVYTKFIPGGVGAIFQLVAVSARLAIMFAEAGRGRRDLPKLLPKFVDLLAFVASNVARYSVLQTTPKLTTSSLRAMYLMYSCRH